MNSGKIYRLTTASTTIQQKRRQKLFFSETRNELKTPTCEFRLCKCFSDKLSKSSFRRREKMRFLALSVVVGGFRKSVTLKARMKLSRSKASGCRNFHPLQVVREDFMAVANRRNILGFSYKNSRNKLSKAHKSFLKGFKKAPQ